ncbi:MAG: HAD hydrolase family protein [Candidatus Shapirobacteria bacterium]
MNNEIEVYGNRNIEIEKSTVGYLLMDVDGCLIEGGLETVVNRKTLEEWSEENFDSIELFRQNIKSLKNKGIKVGLSTGRGLEFSKRLINIFFPDEGGVRMDKSVVEGGLIIYDDETKNYEIASNVDKVSTELLQKNRDKIIQFGESLGGILEEGKFLGVSFNSPVNSEGKRDTDKFRDLLKEKMDKYLVDNLIITNSSTAVDITPKGVDKMTAMESLIGNEGVIYLGDGKNDETSMKNIRVKINLAPGNSHKDIKDFIRTSGKMGILAEEPDLKGTNQVLSFLVEKMRK